MDPEQIPLRDLHLPDAVGWWPLAPGWWILGGLLAIGLLVLLRRAWLGWRQGAKRRLALKQLVRLQREYAARPDPVALGVRLSELLRRTMLAYAPRGEVAGLTGREWLEWLDRGLEQKPFTEGPGRRLQELPYQSEASLSEGEVESLLAVVRRRVRQPLPERL